MSWLTYEAGSPENLQLDLDYGANLEVGESYAYDELGRRSVTTDGLGGKRVVRYDHAGNARINYTYTKLGQLKTQTSDDRRNGTATIQGQNVVYTYDGDRLFRIKDYTNNQETSYAYDLAGNHLREKTVANGEDVQNNYIQYDQLNRMTRVADGDFNVVIGYDDAGNRETVETSYTVNGWRQTFKVMNKFDEMNRQILVDGEIVKDANGRDTAAFGMRSHEIQYDWAGNRVSDRYYAGPTNYETVTTQRYIYDDAGRLSTVFQDGNMIDSRLYDRAGRLIRSGVEGSLVDPAKLAGWKIPKEYRIMQYDAAGRMTRQKVRDLSNATLEDVYFKVSSMVDTDWTHQGYSTAGNLRGYYVVTPNDGPKTAFKSDYIWFDAAKEVNATASNSGGKSTVTTEYDGNGHLIKVTEAPASGVGSTRTYINDVNGQVLLKINGEQRLRSLIANGQLLGTNNGYSVDTSFLNTYQPATSSGMTASAGAYTVRADGETPSSIAQNIWGDGKLWYLIADANALPGNDPLAVGRTLRIPPREGTIHNDSQTFKPYDAANAVGNTTPAMPIPAAPGGKGCGVVGQIVAIVVIVVATMYGQEWAAKLAADTAWASVAGAAGAAAGAMVGSAVTQGASVAMGYQSKFSWKQVAISGVGAAITAGMSGVGEGISGAAMRGALSNAMTQGVSIVLGLQNGFKWRGVVAAAVGSAVGKALGDGLNLNDKVAVAKMDWGERLFKASLVGFAAGTATAAMRGGKISVAQVATDAFGNALGSSLAEQIRPTLSGSSSSGSSGSSGSGSQGGPSDYDWPEEGTGARGPNEANTRDRSRFGSVVQPGQVQLHLNQEPVLDSLQEIALTLGSGPRTNAGSLEYMIQHSDKLNRWLDALAEGVYGGESSPLADGYAVSDNVRNANAPAPFRSVLGDAYRFSANEALDSNNSLSTRAGYGVAATILAIPGVLNDAATGALNSPYDLSYGAQGVYAGLQTNDPYRFSNGLMRSSVGLLNLAGAAGVVKSSFLANLAAGDYAASQAYARSTYEANSTARVPTYTGDVYAADFVGPVEWKYYYRGDATARTEFLSSMAQERGLPATTEFLNSRSSGQLNEIFAEHGIGSQGKPTIGVSQNQKVAEYFARGPAQNQNGFVTTFRLESRDATSFAHANYENPMSFFEVNPAIGLPEFEYLFAPRIDPKFIYNQVPVGPK